MGLPFQTPRIGVAFEASCVDLVAMVSAVFVMHMTL